MGSPLPGPSRILDPECIELLKCDRLKKTSSLSLLRALERTVRTVRTVRPVRTEIATLDEFVEETSYITDPEPSTLAIESGDEVSVVETSETVEIPEDLPPRAVLYRKPVTAGEIYIVKKFNSRQHCWGLAKVLAIICNVRGGVKNNRCLVGFSDNTTQKRPVEADEMAYHETCDTMIPKGSGVVSNSIDTSQRNYYPGIVIETPEASNKYRYLIFFDNGHLRYCHHNELHVICDVYRSRASKTDAFWLKDVILHSDQFVLKFRLGQSVTVFRKDLKFWKEGTVKELDCSILRLEFPDGHSGWYHRGSYYFKRFILDDLPPHLMRSSKRRHLVQIQNAFKKAAEPYLAITCNGAIVPAGSLLQLELAREPPYASLPPPASIDEKPQYSKSSRVTRMVPLMVKVPKDLGCHLCNPGCVASEGVIAKINPSYSPLAKPYSVGFRRTATGVVQYLAPCGRTIRHTKDLISFFDQTNLAFCHTNFNFNPDIEPLRVFRLENDCILSQKYDITDGLEDHPIPCVNEVDNTLPEPIKYITKRRFMTPASAAINHENFVSCCTCTDDCRDSTKCECVLLTVNSYLEILPYEEKPLNPEDVLYKHKRLQRKVRSGIFECNSKCQCSSKCGNRVAQFPISMKLQLFHTSTKGWGVRALHDIPEGTFICTYVGILLNELEANEWGVLHGDQYLMDLDHIKIQESLKPDYEEEAPLLSPEEDDEDETDSAIDPEKQRQMAEVAAKLRKRVGERSTWTPRKKKKKPGKPRYPMNSLRYIFPLDQAEYVIDAKTSGNVGRYFNHSCQPNMCVQNVFVSTHDLRFPEVAFFTNKDVYAGTELTWDYNYDVGSVDGKRLYCLCLAPKCRFRLY